ncbi:MAG: antitoxin family protein [Chloroflexota bacterium]|nr:antitoxin family protein [Chloroflexota bacterium]
MSEIIHAVYEQGVLRPLTPLHLPEHTHVQISIDPISNAEVERQRVRQALIAGGVIQPHLPATPIQPVSEEALATAAQALANAGSLSELIIAERDGR